MPSLYFHIIDLIPLFTREIWQYENIDLELFNNKMNEINWNEKIGILDDVDDMVEEFTKLYFDIAKQCIPTKTITVRDFFILLTLFLCFLIF
jgi:hypothetical protein